VTGEEAAGEKSAGAAEGGPAAGRPSAVLPGKLLERRVPPFFALFFYGFAAAAAWALLYNADPGRSAELWSVREPGKVAGAAAGATALLLALRWGALRFSRSARALESEFGWILGRQRKWECLLLALLSGVAEEYFFRGWLQEKIGMAAAAAIFGALHWPVNRNFILWPVLAGGAGLLFGWLTLWTGSLIPAATAHVAYNAVALWRITGRYAGWEETGVARYVREGAR